MSLDSYRKPVQGPHSAATPVKCCFLSDSWRLDVGVFWRGCPEDPELAVDCRCCVPSPINGQRGSESDS